MMKNKKKERDKKKKKKKREREDEMKTSSSSDETLDSTWLHLKKRGICMPILRREERKSVATVCARSIKMRQINEKQAAAA